MTSVAKLLGSEAEVTQVLNNQLSRVLVLPAGVVGFAGVAEVLASIWGLLDSMEVDQILAAAWERHEKISQAKSDTAGKPLATRTVAMNGRRLVSVHHPTVDAMIGGARHSVVQLELRLELMLKGVEVIVTAGQVSGIRPGSADALVTLDVLNPMGFGRKTVFKDKKTSILNLAPRIQPPLAEPYSR